MLYGCWSIKCMGKLVEFELLYEMPRYRQISQLNLIIIRLGWYILQYFHVSTNYKAKRSCSSSQSYNSSGVSLRCRIKLCWSWKEIEGKRTECSYWLFFSKLVAYFVECFLPSFQYHIDCLVCNLILYERQPEWMYHACFGFHKCLPPILSGMSCLVCSIKQGPYLSIKWDWFSMFLSGIWQFKSGHEAFRICKVPSQSSKMCR